MKARVETGPAVRQPWFVPLYQLLFWILVQPSGWRKYLESLDPTLAPSFCLAELNLRQWRNPRLRGLLLSTGLSLAIINPVLIFIILLATGFSPETVVVSMVIGLGYTLTTFASAAALISFTSGAVYSTFLGLGIGLLAARTDYFFIPVALAAGLTGAAQINLARGSGRPAWYRSLASMASGLMIAALGILIFFGISSGAFIGGQHVPEVDQPLTGSAPLVFLASSAPFFLGLTWLTLRLRTGEAVRGTIPLSLGLTAILAAGYLGLLVLTMETLLLPFLAGIAGGIFVSLLFGLAATIANRLSGPPAAAVAGALVAGIGWVPLAPFVVLDYQHDPLILLTAFLVLFLALSSFFWRPILFFPLAVIWNNLCYSLDIQRKDGQLPNLKKHAAFWDENQRLVWPGLDDYLLMVAERQPERLNQILLDLSNSAQQPAVQAVQIELAARQLEAVTNLEELAGSYRITAAGILVGAASVLLSTFARLSQDIERALNQTSVYQRRLLLGIARDQLAVFQRELFLATGRHAQRFAPAAGRWTSILSAELETIVHTARQEREIENPYICGIPIGQNQPVFVGRADIFTRIDALLGEGPRPPLLLYGQRRMGKTSLLLNLGHFLPQASVPCFIDCQALAGYQESSELIPAILEAIRQEARRQRSLDLPPYEQRSETGSTFLLLNQWINAVEQILEKRGLTLLLALDEYSALESIFRAMPDLAQIYLGLIRHIVQHRSRFKFLLASAYTLDELQTWHEFLINAQMVKVGYLTEAESLQLIEQPVRNFELFYRPEASRKIYELTRGYPHLIQSLCFELVMLKNEQPSGERFLANLTDIENAAQRSLISSSFFFNDLRQTQIPRAASEMLDGLALLGPGAVIGPKEWKLGFPRDFESNLAVLLKRDLIEAHQNGFRFQVELVRRWFAGQARHRSYSPPS